MRLLPLAALTKTGPVDHADWNYRPGLGLIQRLRFSLVLELIGSRRFHRLLEIGYGSGVFQPELAEHCDRLLGVDIHAQHQRVQNTLSAFAVESRLYSAPAEALPFADRSIDCLVAVSALEFVADLDAVCSEADRVLTGDGSFLVVTPGSSPLLDFGLRVLTGKSAKADFGDRRERIVPALERWFDIAQLKKAPSVGHQAVCLYQALDCRPSASRRGAIRNSRAVSTALL